MATVEVQSPDVSYTPDFIQSNYTYHTTKVDTDASGTITATPVSTKYLFRTQRRVPKVGVMLVGWGGNNGSTVTAAVLANKHNMEWPTKEGLQKANYFGSVTQASTVFLGTGPEGEVYVPMKSLLPMVDPNDIVLDGKSQSSVFIHRQDSGICRVGWLSVIFILKKRARLPLSKYVIFMLLFEID
jgi:myo-inositol-1-phosphate synthase